MAIDLSALSAPWAFARGTLHATAGNLDVVTLPSWCKCLTIRAGGSGNVILSHTGAQDSAIGATTKFTVAVGNAITLRSAQLSSYPLRLTGSVNSDPVEYILEQSVGA